MTAAHADRLLVVTLSNIGDLIMTTPVFEALSQTFPGQPIDCLGDARSCELLAAAPYIGDIFIRDKRAAWSEQLSLLLRLRRRRYRLIADLRTPLIPYLLRGERRLIKSRTDRPGIHAVEEHFETIRAVLSSDTAIPPCRLYLGATAQARAAALLETLPGECWLAIAPGANWPGKKWPAAHYQALLQTVPALFDGVIIVGSSNDVDDARTLTDAGLPIVNAVGRTDLPLAAALLARAHVFVGNDSGLGHMAAAVGVPSLTVFGPGRPQRYRPWGNKAEVIMAPDADLARLTPAAVCDRLRTLTASQTG